MTGGTRSPPLSIPPALNGIHLDHLRNRWRSMPSVAEGAEYTGPRLGEQPQKLPAHSPKYGGYVGITLEATLDRDETRKLAAVPRAG